MTGLKKLNPDFLFSCEACSLSRVLPRDIFLRGLLAIASFTSRPFSFYCEACSQSRVLPRDLLTFIARLARNREFYLATFLLLPFTFTFGQDSTGTRAHLDTLCSPHMHGRGYVNNGDKIASEYISSEFKKYGLKSFLFETYQQPFPVAVNAISNVQLSIDKNPLVPGKDFLLHPASPAIKKDSYKILEFDKETVSSDAAQAKFRDQNIAGSFILVDHSGLEDSSKLKLFESMKQNPYSAKGIILLTEKLTHGISPKVKDYPIIEILKSSLPAAHKKITIEVEGKFYEKYFTQNVIGYVEGTQFPDSFIVFSAHYDHLGRLSNDCYFPGANDNASGTSMLLRLAKHYSQHPQKLSVVFMAFGAEEAGLVGSKYFTLHPLFPLEKIRFMINMDILGTGDEGIMAVNATECPAEFDLMKRINAEKNLLTAIGSRGKASNSDHYFFAEKGVPAFFIYTLGGIKAYHDIFDRPETLPLNEFEDIFKLLEEFTGELQK